MDSKAGSRFLFCRAPLSENRFALFRAHSSGRAEVAIDKAANLFAGVTTGQTEEVITEILVRPDLKIERIVSTGQASPPGFWYDQPWDEWVTVLAGAARLRFESLSLRIANSAPATMFSYKPMHATASNGRAPIRRRYGLPFM